MWTSSLNRTERRSSKYLEKLGLLIILLVAAVTFHTQRATLQLTTPPAEPRMESLIELSAPALDPSQPMLIQSTKAQAVEAAPEPQEPVAVPAAGRAPVEFRPTEFTPAAEPSASTWHLTEETLAEELSFVMPLLSPTSGIRLNRGPKRQLTFPDADLERIFTVIPSEGKLILDQETRLALTFSIGDRDSRNVHLKPIEFRGKAFINQYQMGVIQFFLN